MIRPISAERMKLARSCSWPPWPSNSDCCEVLARQIFAERVKFGRGCVFRESDSAGIVWIDVFVFGTAPFDTSRNSHINSRYLWFRTVLLQLQLTSPKLILPIFYGLVITDMPSVTIEDGVPFHVDSPG